MTIAERHINVHHKLPPALSRVLTNLFLQFDNVHGHGNFSVSKVRCYLQKPWWYRFNRNKPRLFVFNGSLRFSTDYDWEYALTHVNRIGGKYECISLIGHEVYHLYQYHKHGRLKMWWAWVGALTSRRFHDHWTEVEAEKFERFIEQRGVDLELLKGLL